MKPAAPRKQALAAFLERLRVKHERAARAGGAGVAGGGLSVRAARRAAAARRARAALGDGDVAPSSAEGREGDGEARDGHAEAATSAGFSPCHGDDVLLELVRSFLMWESTRAKAEGALKRIAAQVVDINELRVCMPEEVVEIIGANVPRAEERAAGLRATLHEIFRREHRLRLGHLREKSKKEARAYLDSLVSAPPYVAARVALVSLNIHAVPLDDRTHALLRHAKVLLPEAPLADAIGVLERTVKADAAALMHAALQAWSETAPPLPPPPVRKPAADVKVGKGRRAEAPLPAAMVEAKPPAANVPVAAPARASATEASVARSRKGNASGARRAGAAPRKKPGRSAKPTRGARPARASTSAPRAAKKKAAPARAAAKRPAARRAAKGAARAKRRAKPARPAGDARSARPARRKSATRRR